MSPTQTIAVSGVQAIVKAETDKLKAIIDDHKKRIDELSEISAKTTLIS